MQQSPNRLNAYNSDYIVVVYCYDEPYTNRFYGGLDTAMYRCGASRAIYGSPNFKIHSAYILVGIPGCGEGNGAEAYQGAMNDDPNAWCDIAFSIVNGALQGVSANYTPKSLTDYGYTGDLNANYTTNTNQLSDGAGLGNTALWSGVSGSGKPQDNATYGATFGQNIYGQITPSNASTYIANAAIGAAQIGSIALVGTSNFSVKTATSGNRMEMDGQVIKVFDAAGVVRIKIGNLSA